MIFKLFQECMPDEGINYFILSSYDWNVIFVSLNYTYFLDEVVENINLIGRVWLDCFPNLKWFRLFLNCTYLLARVRDTLTCQKRTLDLGCSYVHMYARACTMKVKPNLCSKSACAIFEVKMITKSILAFRVLFMCSLLRKFHVCKCVSYVV